jgi:hypothetical protein
VLSRKPDGKELSREPSRIPQSGPRILSQVYVPKKTSLVDSDSSAVPTKRKLVDRASVNLALALVPTKASIPTTVMEVDLDSVISMLNLHSAFQLK